jgi:hypothetical protein
MAFYLNTGMLNVSICRLDSRNDALWNEPRRGLPSIELFVRGNLRTLLYAVAICCYMLSLHVAGTECERPKSLI